MFAETSLLMGTKLQVMNAEGQVWNVQMDPNITIAELKQKAFEKFYNAANIDVSWDAFRGDFIYSLVPSF